MDQYNPGEQLRLLLMELYPPDSKNKKSFIDSVDNAFLAEGELAEYVYKSIINYLLRRLITTAEFIKRKHDPAVYPPTTYIIEIRKFIRDFTRIPQGRVERVIALILDCLRERERNPTQKTKNRIKRKTRESGEGCYICGSELDFETNDEGNSAQVEHKWPRTIGGSNHDDNLCISCRRCNQDKSDFIDASDFHYEEMCLYSNDEDPNFHNELKWIYKVSILAKSNYSCVVCDRPSKQVGEMKFARRELNDSWHFLNIDAYCGEHA
jgi:hypothetical protein